MENKRERERVSWNGVETNEPAISSSYKYYSSKPISRVFFPQILLRTLISLFLPLSLVEMRSLRLWMLLIVEELERSSWRWTFSATRYRPRFVEGEMTMQSGKNQELGFWCVFLRFLGSISSRKFHIYIYIYIVALVLVLLVMSSWDCVCICGIIGVWCLKAVAILVGEKRRKRKRREV